MFLLYLFLWFFVFLSSLSCFFFFFFFKQKTAYEMRISDWSSDVCSSDLATQLLGTCRGRRGLTIKGSFSTFQLVGKQPLFPGPTLGALLRIGCRVLAAPAVALASRWLPTCAPCERELAQITQIGRASCRERVCQYV